MSLGLVHLDLLCYLVDPDGPMQPPVDELVCFTGSVVTLDRLVGTRSSCVLRDPGLHVLHTWCTRMVHPPPLHPDWATYIYGKPNGSILPNMIFPINSVSTLWPFSCIYWISHVSWFWELHLFFLKEATCTFK